MRLALRLSADGVPVYWIDEARIFVRFSCAGLSLSTTGQLVSLSMTRTYGVGPLQIGQLKSRSRDLVFFFVQRCGQVE